MTKDAIDQIYDRSRHGDVFAQALMGQILCEGKYVLHIYEKITHWCAS